MTPLSVDLRNKLERTVIEARDVSEAGARVALEALAVHHHEPYAHQTPEQRKLRNRLRAHARQLGDIQNPKGEIATAHIIHECAYEHWHRMLFARFLAENDLLIEPSAGMAISLAEAEELAKEANVDLWTFASRCAQLMLPEIFRPNDPVLQISLTNEYRIKLEWLLASLAPETFRAEDALGWVYQFWQTKRKEAVNKSGVKIGADELPAVTQLFTEDYMVDFLLDNTLGAWHAGKILAANPKLADNASSEEELRKAVGLPRMPWRYLRFIKSNNGKWMPAAGTFDGWPKATKELKCLDPCMGSGHFVVSMLERLVALRMEEEELSEIDAVAAVIRDNLFGLEIDPRCTQIAAFNVALAAWRRVGYCPLPAMNLACSGLAPNSSKADWLRIAGDDEKLQRGMERLYEFFIKAPLLGSLINPRAGADDLLVAAFHELQPLLENALAQEARDDVAHEMAVTARGLAKAAEILAGQFTLVATNVPYLTRGKQCDELKMWADNYIEDAKLDLATVFTIRCLDFLDDGATTALVVPQNWLALKSFAKLRVRLLSDYQWRVLVKLGPAAFSDMNWWAANTALLVFAKNWPNAATVIAGLDASVPRRIYQKEVLLQGGSINLGESGRNHKIGKVSGDDYSADEHFGSFAQTADGEVYCVNQLKQMGNHGAVVVFGKSAGLSELAGYATVHYGFKPGQTARVTRCFWEQKEVAGLHWQLMESTPEYDITYSGKSEVCMRPDEMRRQGITEFGESGVDAWRHKGIVVAKMGRFPHSIYCGELFDDNTYVLLPKRPGYLPAVWAFITSGEFFREVRGRNQKVAVDTGSMIHIPFDPAHWQKVAAEKYPHGLPEPFSSDPTQWLFNGHPKGADQPLHVAVARLLGYEWPRQTGSSFPDCPALCPDGMEKLADADGIVCVPSVRGEEPAAERLRKLLTAAHGKEWKASRELELIRSTGSDACDLEEWLRNDFFAQHCDLFHQRPFLWHIWDGRKRDGFHALVNYHTLASAEGKGRQTLESLTHSYLGDWITRQKDGEKRGEEGAEDRLAAASELQKRLIAILEGEPPFDLFVRWKPVKDQAIGWEPDINDGVRMNIRPFLASDLPNGKKGTGILRYKPNIKWEKDRGKEPERKKNEYPWFWGWDEKAVDFMGGMKFDGNRWNNCHYTNEMKRRARKESL